MKNTKLNIRKLATSGFSLVEMLVVIAVIGVIAAIAIPQMGKVNDSAKDAAAKRNAQSIASVASAALSAGYSFSGVTDASGIYSAVNNGVTVTGGAFSGKTFKVPNLPSDQTDIDRVLGYLDYDASTGIISYDASAQQ